MSRLGHVEQRRGPSGQPGAHEGQHDVGGDQADHAGPQPDQSHPVTKNTPEPAPNSGGWDYYDPWIWTSWFPMIEASSASIPWMFATGNHEPELFSSAVAADKSTVAAYEPLGYGGIEKD
jgi:hypothetical protein